MKIIQNIAIKIQNISANRDDANALMEIVQREYHDWENILITNDKQRDIELVDFRKTMSHQENYLDYSNTAIIIDSQTKEKEPSQI